MLTEEQIDEIRGHLEKARNPIFYYDNDVDGLCSFILLRKFIGRGHGVAIRSYPGLNADYARKASELKADYVFVLDKPILDRGFVEAIDLLGLPFVWIDHHEVQVGKFEKEFGNFHVYNPVRNKGKNKSSEPTTYLCYNIVKRKEDMWIAVAGCVSDRYLPNFSEEFGKNYKEYWGVVKDAFDAYYKTEIGRIAMALSFGLKDSITSVVQMQNFIISCSGPEEVLAEVNSNSSFRHKYLSVKKKYDALVEKAKEDSGDKLIFFEYGGEISISADISNELCYIYPEKYVAVAYRKGGVANVSMRGKNIRAILESVLERLKDATGGGHEDAVGARIKLDDLEKFKEYLKEEILKNNNGKK